MGEGRAAKSVLIVDDNRTLLSTLERGWKLAGYKPGVAWDSAGACELASNIRFDLALIDLHIATSRRTECGIDLIRHLKQIQPDLCAVLFSGKLSIVATERAIKAGALFVFDKLDTPEEILYAVKTGERMPRDQCAETPTLERMICDYTARVVEDCGGNRTEAAKLLGVSRSTLYRTLDKESAID